MAGFGSTLAMPERRAKRSTPILDRGRKRPSHLTPRLAEVAEFIIREVPYKEAAAQMGITHDSFKVYAHDVKALYPSTRGKRALRTALVGRRFSEWLQKYGKHLPTAAIDELIAFVCVDIPEAERWLA